MQNSSMLLDGDLVCTRACLFFLVKLALWKVLPVPANLVTFCSSDEWGVRCPFLLLLLWAKSSCKIVVYISKCWMSPRSAHVPASQAPFFFWHCLPVYSPESHPDTSLCCDLLLLKLSLMLVSLLRVAATRFPFNILILPWEFLQLGTLWELFP